METRVTKLLQIEHPIIQGGMVWLSNAILAAAVSNAGGLGIIAAGHAPPSWVLEQVQLIKKMTNKPFGVNIMLLSPSVDEVIKIVIQERVPIVTTGAGNPSKYIEQLKAVGTIVIPVIPSCAIAKKVERSGADAIVAEGTESGGHIGELTTMALVPQVVDSVNIPVIAAGGIADGRGLVAALALGAEGVQMGTRFICSTECTVSDEYKEAVLKAKDRDTLVTGRFTGHPVRCIKSNFSRNLLKLEKDGITIKEFEKLGAGSLRKAVEGNVKEGTIMSGQISGLVKDIKPCQQITNDIMNETQTILDSLHKR
ncbi:MAG: enoyl-[acyl-carrier-protein] reductase FabK [Clostridiales bacterium]|nr:enoyl-[acyl-carrier-protein] reductase FabK [Clostridiales bacterium]